MDDSRVCWSADLRADGQVEFWNPDPLRAETVSPTHGVFHHPHLDVRADLRWIRAAPDAWTARLSITAAAPGVTIHRAIFRLPGFIEMERPDALYYPYGAGQRIEDPAAELFVPMASATAAWKDRRLSVWKRGFALDERAGVVDFAHDYSSRCSMAWMDYAGSRGGLYLGAHDPDLEHAVLGVRARRGRPGLELRIEKRLNRPVCSWTCDFVIAFHGGDWRRGADIYRAWFESALPPIRRAPASVRRAPGVACHYDFKWQDGSVGHRFRDLPALFGESASRGFTHLLVAGWNVDGFDTSYPEFRPDPGLGNEDELREAVARVRAAGGHVFFYVNAFSFDTRHPEFETLGRSGAVKEPDGSPRVTRWGSRDLAGMCNSHPGWAERVRGNIRYVLCTLGADGVYVDQLAVRPQTCSDPRHVHLRSWVAENVARVTEIRAGLETAGRGDAVLFSEFLTDALATQLDFQLCHTVWASGVRYAYPELFRYTFPGAMLIDQVLQKPWPGEPAETEERHVRDVIARLFVTGTLFWAYDHVLANGRLRRFLDGARMLREKALDYFAEGVYLDTPPVAAPLPEGLTVKAFHIPGRGTLLAAWNRTGKRHRLTLEQPLRGTLFSADLDGVETRDPVSADHRQVTFSDAPLSLLVVERPGNSGQPARKIVHLDA